MMQVQDFCRHVFALSLKESRQILRDKSSILVGVVLPIILLILFGYGISFDVKDIRLAVVADQSGTQSVLHLIVAGDDVRPGLGDCALYAGAYQ